MTINEMDLPDGEWWALCRQRMQEQLKLEHVEQQEADAIATLSVNSSTVVTLSLCHPDEGDSAWRIDSACDETEFASEHLAPYHFLVAVHEAIESIQSLTATWWAQEGHTGPSPSMALHLRGTPQGIRLIKETMQQVDQRAAIIRALLEFHTEPASVGRRSAARVLH